MLSTLLLLLCSVPCLDSPVVNVAAYGATGDPAVKDCTSAFESALAIAGQRANVPMTTGIPPATMLKIPGGTYNITRPLFVPNGVFIQGEGKLLSKIQMSGVYRYPTLIYGVPFVKNVSGDRVDLFGILDTSVCPSRNMRYGITTKQGHTLEGTFTSANIGRFEGVRDYFMYDTVTIEFLAIPGSGWLPSSSVMGCGQSIEVTRPSPWVVWTSETGNMVLSLKTDNRSYSFILPTKPNSKAFCWQVNLKTGAFCGFVDGVQVQVSADAIPTNTSISANPDYPFHLGRAGYKNVNPPINMTLGGLHISSTERYVSGIVGSQQKRIDGGVVNDAYRYFNRDDQQTTVGFLPFDDPLSQLWLKWVPGDGMPECMLIVPPMMGGDKPSMTRDIGIWSRGPAILLGAVLDWTTKDCYLQSETAVGIGSIPAMTSYVVTANNCTLAGGDSAISFGTGILNIQDCYFIGAGRDTIRLHGSTLNATNLFSSGTGPNGQSFLRYFPASEANITLKMTNVYLDYENWGVRDALIVVDPEMQFPLSLNVDNLSCALTGPSETSPRPVCRLSPMTGTKVKATCDINNTVTNACTMIVKDGQGWRVTEDNPNARVVPVTPIVP